MRRCSSRRSLVNGASGSSLFRRSRVVLPVTAALTREKKAVILENIKSKLQDSALVFGMTTKGLTVKQMEELRRSFPPEQTSVYVCKNSLMKRAINEVDGWSSLAPTIKNESAWIFVKEDGISETVKTWLDFQQAQTKVLRDSAEKDEVVSNATELMGGTLGGKLCPPEEVAKFKELPTKTEALATLLGLLNGIPVGLLSTLNQVPMQLAFNLERMTEFDETKSRIVREFVKTEDGEESTAA